MTLCVKAHGSTINSVVSVPVSRLASPGLNDVLDCHAAHGSLLDLSRVTYGHPFWQQIYSPLPEAKQPLKPNWIKQNEKSCFSFTG